MHINDKIYVAGHKGMVGSAICRKLHNSGYNNILSRSSSELDLRDQKKVESFFFEEQIDYVFLAAAMVGGIMANNIYRADFLYNNLQIQNNVIHSSYLTGVKKLMFLGSSCIYPKMAAQPLKEEYLLTGSLEPTNEPYAIAKLAGIKLCESYRRQYKCNYITVIPTSLYGYNDSYHHENSHVLPALIARFHEAKLQALPSVTIWGSGNPKREFLFVDDLADACYTLMQTYNEPGVINIGTGEDESIINLAMLVKQVVGYNGAIEFDTSKPDGTPRKVLDVSKMKRLGDWAPKINIMDGLRMSYEDYLSKRPKSAFNSAGNINNYS